MVTIRVALLVGREDVGCNLKNSVMQLATTHQVIHEISVYNNVTCDQKE
jgi:hypothetical protein